MKKIILTGGLLMVFCSVFCQDKKLTFGIGAGMVGSNINYQHTAINADMKTGYNGFAFVDLPISNTFSIQTEVGYYQLGNYISGKVNGYNEANEVTSINYLMISVLPKIKIKKTNLAFFLGPSLGLALSSTAIYDNYPQADIQYAPGGYKSTDIFAVGGVEYFFPCNLGVTFRYMQGLTNIAGSNYSHTIVKITNSALSLSVLYRL